MQAWESKQKSYNLSKSFNKGSSARADRESNPNGVKEEGDCYVLPDGVNNGVPLPKKLFNKDGMFDLSLATGKEACNYLRRLGISIAQF
jgi:hypothetical protein